MLQVSVHRVKYFIVTLLADGLALGAAAGLSKTDVEVVIFLAIMLHKVESDFYFNNSV